MSSSPVGGEEVAMGFAGHARRVVAGAVVSASLLVVLCGCHDGPGEKAGRAVDRTAEKIGDVFRK